MASSIDIGAHVEQTDPVAEAQARETTLVQFFLGDPQGYKGPEVRYSGGAEGLRKDAEAAGVDLYVHAPYIVNVATTNNRIRIPSRKLLQQHMDAAAEIGAKGLIVHGGHVNQSDDPATGFDNWRKAVEATDIAVALEHSTNLTTWAAAPATEEVIANNGVVKTIRATIPVNIHDPARPKEYLRARVRPVP